LSNSGAPAPRRGFWNQTSWIHHLPASQCPVNNSLTPLFYSMPFSQCPFYWITAIKKQKTKNKKKQQQQQKTKQNKKKKTGTNDTGHSKKKKNPSNMIDSPAHNTLIQIIAIFVFKLLTYLFPIPHLPFPLTIHILVLVTST
jgi:hypothetical protein